MYTRAYTFCGVGIQILCSLHITINQRPYAAPMMCNVCRPKPLHADKTPSDMRNLAVRTSETLSLVSRRFLRRDNIIRTHAFTNHSVTCTCAGGEINPPTRDRANFIVIAYNIVSVIILLLLLLLLLPTPYYLLRGAQHTWTEKVIRNHAVAVARWYII